MSPAASRTRLRLGFGCGSLGGESSYGASCALVEAAFDAGIRHFDVAPSYGGGMAERILGHVLAPVRSEVTLVSKAGIAHPRGTGVIRAARKALVPLRQHFPGIWQRAGRKVRRAAAPTGRFAPEQVLASLEESLRRLCTDYLDVFLLHEVQPEDLSTDLDDLLDRLSRTDRVRGIGTGTGVAASLAMAARPPRWLRWVQTDHYWGAFQPVLRQRYHVVTHRVLRTGLKLVREPAFLAEIRRQGATDLEAVLSDARIASGLLLRAALAQLGDSALVLVSTTRVERLREILAAASVDPTPDLTSRLNEVFTEMAAAGPSCSVARPMT